MIRTIRTLKVEPVKVGHEHPIRVIGMKENIAIKSGPAKSGRKHPIRIIGMQRRLIDLLFKVGQFSQLSHSGKQDDRGVKSL